MRRRISVQLLLLALCATTSPLWARRKPRPKPASRTTPTFSVTSRVVVLDVVVLNHNQPVCGLSEPDFKVFENRQYQPIGFFQPHCGKDLNAKDAQNTSRQPPPPPLPPDTYDNLPITRVTDSVTVLLLDGLNTEVADSQYLRLQMIQYLKNLPPGRRIAIFTLGSRLRMLQGFTTNSQQLLAAVSSRKFTLAASLLPSANHNLAEQQELGSLQQAGVSPLAIQNMQNFMSESDTQQTGMRVEITLDAMQQLSRYLSGIPGRKNLVWFSGSFPLEFDSAIQTPAFNTYTVETGSFQDELKATASMLAAARVAVYPVDVRGVLIDPMFDASQPGEAGGPLQLLQNAKMADLERIEEHGTMDILARETGGRAVYDSNALKEAVAHALSDGENFYTIAYRPRNANFNGAWRKIAIFLDVKPPKGKYKLLYRDGYFATSGTPARDTGDQGARQIFGAAMEDGAPPSSQILFKARVVAPGKEPLSGPILGANQKMKGRAARCVVDYAISLQHVTLAVTPQGIHTGRVFVEALAYNDAGDIVNSVSNQVPVALTPSAWPEFAEDGFQVHQVLDLPKGDIRLRLGIYDPVSGNVGTLEVPLHIGPQTPAANTRARR
jgi:VWFA-related protein